MFQTVLQPTKNISVGVSSTIIPPVMMDHTSVLLDFDVFTVQDVPQKADELWVCLNEFRNIKNDLFEESVTDAARKLFA